jgi:hypothetical protein
MEMFGSSQPYSITPFARANGRDCPLCCSLRQATEETKDLARHSGRAISLFWVELEEVQPNIFQPGAMFRA